MGIYRSNLCGVVESDELADFAKWRRYTDAEGRVLWTTDRARYLIEGGDRVVIDSFAAGVTVSNS